MRLASALALAAVLLRVLLPALHTHTHHHGAVAGSDGLSVTVCSCGAVHVWDDVDDGTPERADASGESHHCLACQIEEGTPCGCPPADDWSTVAHAVAGELGPPRAEVLAGRLVQLPRTRAPPVERV